MIRTPEDPKKGPIIPGVRCETCRHWEPLGNGVGFCALTQAFRDKPEHPESKAVAYSDAMAVVRLATDARFCCSQYQKPETA